MKQEVERGITITHKQETLEEAANKAYCFYGDVKLREAFELGAKWQAERMYSEEELQQKIDAHLEVAKDLWLSTIKEQKKMYSEEEVFNILTKFWMWSTLHTTKEHLIKWFEQFKKEVI